MRKRSTHGAREDLGTDGAQLHVVAPRQTVVHASAHAAIGSVEGSPSSYAEGCVNTPHTESALPGTRKRCTGSTRENFRTDGAQLRSMTLAGGYHYIPDPPPERQMAHGHFIAISHTPKNGCPPFWTYDVALDGNFLAYSTLHSKKTI